MLRISSRQLAAFESAAARSFEDAMVTHLLQFAPRHAASLGEATLRQLVNTGAARARAVGFDRRGPARFYIELMVTFGSDFDSDPLLPWRHYLHTEIDGDPLQRARRLHETVRGYRRIVLGDSYELEAAAVRRVLRTSPDSWLSSPDSEAWARTRAIFPQKCDFAGADNFAQLVEQARGEAASLGLASDCVGGLAALMTGLGHRCLHDPQFSWLGRVFETPGTQEERRAAIGRRIFAFFRVALADLEGRPDDA